MFVLYRVPPVLLQLERCLLRESSLFDSEPRVKFILFDPPLIVFFHGFSSRLCDSYISCPARFPLARPG